MKADVSIADDCYHLVNTALKHLGHLNGLVNSAGIADRGTPDYKYDNINKCEILRWNKGA